MEKVLYVFIIAFPVFFLSCQNNNNSKNENIEVVSTSAKENKLKGKRTGFYLEVREGVWEFKNGNHYYSVNATLVNNTADTITYGCFSCSWDQNYIVEGKLVWSHRIECDKNFPTVITIFPYSEDIKRKLIFQPSNDTLQMAGTIFRIGFNYVPVKSYENIYDKVNLLFKPTNLIWSDTLVIN